MGNDVSRGYLQLMTFLENTTTEINSEIANRRMSRFSAPRNPDLKVLVYDPS